MNTTSTTLSAPTSVPAEAHLPQWHVMTHLEMARFQKWFSNVNAMRLRDGLPVIQTFYPYEFLRGVYLTSRDVAMLMILFKIAREENKHKRDNITDIIGYAVLAEDLANIHIDVEE